ncbi:MULTISPECIES: helix-turn-helix domain-containing protein [unclassified Phenylobacterium]|uniref:helix-turn-helix domain-containing protein n=1 Tax=unclassified Phenylobacterium TaxID=2640670 RepID=UPI000839E2E0|nr:MULTISPECIES: helix-turn-helix domain-containing protein [unclassified Phenylobacterium]
MFEGYGGAGDGAGRGSITPPVIAPRRRPAPRLVLQGAQRSREPGATIYAQSDPAEFIYQVVSGVVRTITLHRDGRRIVHGFHLPGEIFGMEREKIHHCSAEAVDATRLVQCPVTRLNALAEIDKEAAKELWMSLLVSRDRTAERFMYVLHGTAFEKLAYFLIDLAWRTQSRGRIELPMSRYDIADYLGLSSETVSRTFTAFRTRGLISTSGRVVRLLDKEMLREDDASSADDDDGLHWPRTLP